MSAKKKSPIPAEKVALYEKLLAPIPEIERKGAENPYTSQRQHVFSVAQPGGKIGTEAPSG